MFELNNTHIIIILIVVIVFTFIYNYDVYVVAKGEPICKPVFVTKKVIDSNFNKIKSVSPGQSLKKLVMDDSIIEKFTNLELIENFQNSNLSTPNSSLLNLTIPEVNTHYKRVVIDNLINVLHNIPTTYSTEIVKELVEYFAIIYQTSPSIDKFFDNVATSTKINQEPYNSQYSHLILYLIAKFDSIYNSECMDKKCVNDIKVGPDSVKDVNKCKINRSVIQEMISSAPTIPPATGITTPMNTSTQQISAPPMVAPSANLVSEPSMTSMPNMTPTMPSMEPISSQTPPQTTQPVISERFNNVEFFNNLQSYNNNFNGFASF